MMATVHSNGEQFFYAVKGVPEAVIAACDTEFTGDGQRDLDDRARKDWTDRNTEAAQEGLRLLALAMKTEKSKDGKPHEGIALVGFVCLLDPLREGVSQAVQACRDAGVRVVMLTGDHAKTAATIAGNAGLGGGELTVIEGSELSDLEGDSASDKLLSADVFARVTPKTKLDLVSLFQEAGHVVAMTGDGVNDAPALKKSDIGIAMGQRGTQVAREAADMVLKDDAFETIIVAMRQGRTIFDNIRKFVVYLMSCNVSEVLVVGLAVGIGLPTPLLPLQILFLNLVTDVFPAFALGLGRGDEGVMKRPPRDPQQALVDRPRWLLIGLLGVAITLATLGAFALALRWLELEPDPAVTVAFLTLSLAQLWNVFNMRAADSGLFRNEVTGNGYVWAALALCLGLIALALWLPGLTTLLRLPDPGFPGLSLAVAMSLLPLVLGQIILATRRRGWLVSDRSWAPQ